MSASSNRSSWRNRLSRALFGIHADSSEDLREGVSRREEDDHVEKEEESAPPNLEPAQPISMTQKRPDQESTIASSPQSEFNTFAPSSFQSVKKKNFQSMLSSSVENTTKMGPVDNLPQHVAKDRITIQPSAHRKSISNEEHSGSEKIGNGMAMPQANRGKGIDIATSLGTSLSQGVKTLSERYTHSREASENFKSMRERSADGRSSSPNLSKDPSLKRQQSRRSSESSSGSDVYAHHRTTSSSSIPKTSTTTETMQKKLEPNKPVDEHSETVAIPEQLQKGEVMLKVTSRKVMQRVVRIDADAGQILWDSKKNNRVNLESIREVRSGSAARSHRTSLSIAAAHEQRWISIIYQANSIYKALHLIALSDASFERWYTTLQAVQNERKLLASCVDMSEKRQSLWLRQQFKGADSSKDARLDFFETVRLCRRLGIMSNKEDLRKRFDEADKEGLGYLDFVKFQHFVAFLKRRVEVEEIFNRLADVNLSTASMPSNPDISKAVDNGQMTDSNEVAREAVKVISQKAFYSFLKEEQGHTGIQTQAMADTYRRFCTTVNISEEGISYDGFLAFLMSSDNAILSDQSSLANNRTKDAKSSPEEEDAVNASRAHAETAEALIAISGQINVTHDMTRPLSEYYISSSHNTYLVKGQLTGESTAEGYIRALMQGARSVELDCWDGSGNEPVVTHGHTLTSKVPFRDVIQAIGKYAFVASPYPLILSLEVHTDLAQQDVIAEILRTVLGEKLLQSPLKGYTGSVLPSPQDLIGKILVKAKNILLNKKVEDPDRYEMVVQERNLTSTTDTTTESENEGLLLNAQNLVRSVTQKGRRLSQKTRRGESSIANTTGEKKKVMSPALASLLIYTIGVKHRGINKKEDYAIEHMISLSERTALKYAKSSSNGGGHNWEDLIKHNRTHLTRIYPSMHTFARLSYSANFMPNIFWRLGCQLVALNWQTIDLGLEMNQAMFMRNGRSGYVLKPEALRKKEKYSLSEPMKEQSDNTKNATFVTLTNTLISAQQLPKYRQGSSKKGNENDGSEGETNVLDPYISVAVIVPDTPSFSVSPNSKTRPVSTSSSMDLDKSESIDQPNTSRASSSSRPTQSSTSSSNSLKTRKSLCRARTSTIWQNGFNPIWNETLSFQIRLPCNSSDVEIDPNNLCKSVRGLLDLCFIRFEVRNETKREQGIVGSEIQREQSGSSSNSNLTKKNELNDEIHSSSTSSMNNNKGNTQGPTYEIEISDDFPCLATYMISLGALEQGYHHVPLYDSSMTQHLFSTLFVHTKLQIESSK